MADNEFKKKCSQFTLEEFPGYTCYIFEPVTYSTDFRQESFDRRSVSLKYGINFGSRAFYKECCVIPNKLTAITPYGPGVNFKDDVLLIHPDSGVPRSLITKGTVYNERGTSTPTKVVVPSNYPQCILSKSRKEPSVLFMVNDNAKLVFAISSYTSESLIGGSLMQWKAALWDSPDVFESFNEYIDGFTMPFGTRLFTVIQGISDLDKVLMWNMIPDWCILHEDNLCIGSDEPTVDMLYSAYMMLQSPDSQIVETAFNMLARSKFQSVRYIIRWLLRGNQRARWYRNKSTTFKWMYTQCCDRTSSMFLPNEVHKKTAVELVRKITNNGIDFDQDGTMKVNDPKWLQDDKIRLLASKI